MDIIKRIDELKKLVDSDKFDKKYEGQKKTEVLARQHVISACEDIREFGDKIIAKVTFGYSDPKTGVSMISETVIADKKTPLNVIKETALLSLIGSIDSSTVAKSEISDKQADVTEDEKADTEPDKEKELENKEETAEKQNDNIEKTEPASENIEESSVDNAAQTEAENTEESVTEDGEDSNNEDSEDVITGNASEIFENKEPSVKNPLNEDFTENKAVDKTEEKVEVSENMQDTKTSKKSENKKPAKKDVDKTDNEKSEKAEIPEYKPKTLDKIQVQEIEVLAKHLAENKDDRNAVLKKFFERLEFHKGLKKEYADEIKNLLADESQRLANRYGEEILNLMFDKAYKLISPETEGENLLLKIDSLKILVCATALVVCEAALHEIMV